MEPIKLNIKSKTIVQDNKTGQNLSKFSASLGDKRVEVEPQQSVLKKAIQNRANGQNIIRILPKAPIPLKTLQGPNGNINVHGSTNKVVSLQIKTQSNKNSETSSKISLLPITLPKDIKTSKVPGLTLIKSTKDVTLKSPIASVPQTVNRISVSRHLDGKKMLTNSASKVNLTKSTGAQINISSISKNIHITKQIKSPDESSSSQIKSVSQEDDKQSHTSVARQLKVVKQSESETKLNSLNTNKMINLKISNGRISDPHTTIKIFNKDSIKMPKQISEKNTSNKIKTVVGEKSKVEQKVRHLDLLVTAKQDLNQKETAKNKTIEDLQRNPRMRSQSLNGTLNTEINNENSIRRLSTSSDSAAAKVKLRISAVKKEKKSNSKQLLCNEEIETSPSDSKYSSSNECSITSNRTTPTSAVTAILNKVDEIIKIEDDPIVIPDSDEKCKLKTPNTKMLQWVDGIGFLKNSEIQFQVNEFGLLEAIENSKTAIDIKRHRISEYHETIYICRNCNCNGSPENFYSSGFCSNECMQSFNRKSDSSIIKPPRKYINRKKLLNCKPSPPTDNMNDDDDVTIVDIKPQKTFAWDPYLAYCKAEKAPTNLFLNPFPSNLNSFKVGMKLEAIDPEHSSVFAVCTIVERKGYRIKLHFDGYPEEYDFWVNADSMDIFPPGWCEKTNRTLQPPRGLNPALFHWSTYLSRTKSVPATRNLFTHLNISSSINAFKVGMKLEADDLRNTGKVCVASVADVIDNRILIHFDGWDESYDYWINITSPYIHPVNWHKKNGFSIVPPPEFSENFSWSSYLLFTRSPPAMEEIFSTREPFDFRPGMKLELVDKRNPSLIRPASVMMTDEYELKVLFDGWSQEYAFWVEDDSPDIHPVGWCEVTGHDLEDPPGYHNLCMSTACQIPGCRGIGNVKVKDLNFHTTLSACPYELNNWNREIDRSGRLENLNGFAMLPLQSDDEVSPKKKRKMEEERIEDEPKRARIIPKEETIELETIPELTLNVSRHVLCDYGPRFHQTYNLWKRNSECITKTLTEIIEKNPLDWSIDEVSNFIKNISGCQHAAPMFVHEEINGAAFLSLRQTDLTDILKIKLGPAIKIYNQIVQLREEVATRFL